MKRASLRFVAAAVAVLLAGCLNPSQYKVPVDAVAVPDVPDTGNPPPPDLGAADVPAPPDLPAPRDVPPTPDALVDAVTDALAPLDGAADTAADLATDAQVPVDLPVDTYVRDVPVPPADVLPVCTAPPIVWCRVQWAGRPGVPNDGGLDVSYAAGIPLDVYGRVYAQGVTDRTHAVDVDPCLVGAAGYGPDGSEPATDAGWQWFAAVPSPGYGGRPGDEVNNDEYKGTFTTPAAGTYDFAFRFSFDAGRSWLYCDRKKGDGPLDGSGDGYQPANAGALVTH